MSYIFLIIAPIGMLCGLATLALGFYPTINEGRIALGFIYLIINSLALIIAIAAIKS